VEVAELNPNGSMWRLKLGVDHPYLHWSSAAIAGRSRFFSPQQRAALVENSSLPSKALVAPGVAGLDLPERMSKAEDAALRSPN